MKAPVGLLSDRTVLRSKMEGPRPDKLSSRCTECRQCKEKHGFPAGVQKVCKGVQSPRKWKIPDESYDSSLDFGALEGTRIPGPLIKRASQAGYSDFETFEFSFFLQSIVIFHCIISAPLVVFCKSEYPLHPLKPCKNSAETVHLLWDK